MTEEGDTICLGNNCLYFDELNNGELFCSRHNKILDESQVVDEELCEDFCHIVLMGGMDD